MAVRIHFYQINSSYSQEYANQYHDGEESEDNIRYHWEDEISITGEVIDIEENKNAEYILTGEYQEKKFSYNVPNMHKITFEIKESQNAQVAVSKSILEKIEKEENKEETIFHFYLKEREVFANPVPGTYIDVADFPQELT